MSLTEKECKMLQNIAENDYADGDPTACVWADCLDCGPNYIPLTSIPGLVASLSKKMLVNVGDLRQPARDRGVQLTEEGLKAYKTLFASNQ